MKNRKRVLFPVLLCLAAATLAQGDSKPEEFVASLSWLAGTWRGPMGSGEYEAYYSTPDGGRVLSENRMLKDGKTMFYEFESWSILDGVVVMQPYPGGKQAASFKLTDISERKAVVENPKNDFPSRIVYHRKADDRLVITLSDPHGGSPKQQVFNLKRVK